MPGDWPPTLKTYVKRCYNSYETEDEKSLVDSFLKKVIENAASNNTLWSKNWDLEKLPECFLEVTKDKEVKKKEEERVKTSAKAENKKDTVLKRKNQTIETRVFHNTVSKEEKQDEEAQKNLKKNQKKITAAKRRKDNQKMDQEQEQEETRSTTRSDTKQRAENQEKEKEAKTEDNLTKMEVDSGKNLATPVKEMKRSSERRSPGSRQKWMKRLLTHTDRIVRKKGGQSKLVRLLQYFSSTPSSKSRQGRSTLRKNLISDFEAVRAESRPSASVSEILGSRGGCGEEEEGLVWEEMEFGKGWSCEELASWAAPLPSPKTVSASGYNSNLTLRQSRMGDCEGESGSLGPEMTWWDEWLGWGWAGPVSPVYFCLACQLGGQEVRG